LKVIKEIPEGSGNDCVPAWRNVRWDIPRKAAVIWHICYLRQYVSVENPYDIVSDEKLQAEEQNNYIKFYLIEKNNLIELNELSEESLEYNCRKHR
jgi:hypothetical protein